MIFPGSLFAGLAAEEMNYSYFEATEARTGTKRTWKLGAKKFQSVT